MKSALSPASCTLNKIATVKTIYELRTSEVQYNELAGEDISQTRPAQPELKFVAGNNENPDLLVAYADNFIWVLKRTDTWLGSSEGNLGSFKPSFFDNSEADSVPLYYDALAASATSDSTISAVLICGIDKTLAPVSNSSQTLSPCSFNSSWTSIAVAYQSGKIAFFTETLSQLCEIHWADSPVIQMNVSLVPCKMSDNGDPSDKGDNRSGFDETLALHFICLCENSVMYMVPYARLCNYISASKMYRAKVASRTLTQLEAPSGIPLNAVSKWDLLDQQYPVGLHIVPMIVKPDSFQHLQAATVLGGFNARPKLRAPYYVRVVLTGLDPYVGVYDHIVESMDQFGGQNLAKLASNYAHRLKSSFWATSSSWLYGQQPSEETMPKKKMTEQTLNLRLGFSDTPRISEQSVLSPIGNLVAIADNLSRVIVIDVIQGCIVRVFKGYRNAKLAWYVATSTEDMKRKGASKKGSKTVRQALFLVIHATKRALLEVWPMMLGARAAAFNVHKNSVLIPVEGNGSVPANNSEQVLVLNLDNGDLLSLVVPYHFAFSDPTGCRQKDILISNRISLILSKPENLNESLSSFLKNSFAQLQSPTFVLENLNALCNYESVEFNVCTEVLLQIQAFLQKNKSANSNAMNISDGTKSVSETQSDRLVHRYNHVFSCNNFYKDLWEMYEPSKSDPAFPIDASELLEQLEFLSHSSNEDFKVTLFHIAGNLETSSDSSRSGWTTGESTLVSRSPEFSYFETIMSLKDFMECFELEPMSETCAEEFWNERVLPKAGLTSEQKKKLGKFIFLPALKGDVPVDMLINILEDNGFGSHRDRFLDLLLSHWLSAEKLLDNYQDSVEMLHLHTLVNWLVYSDYVIEPVVTEENISDTIKNHQKPPWEFIRQTLQCTPNVTAALTAAIMIRGICISKLTNQDVANKKGAKSLDDDGRTNEEIPREKWLKLSYDVELFNLLIYRLEDCVLFAALNASCASPNVLSVDCILSKGKGAISEILANWLMERNVSSSEYKLLSTTKSTLSATMIKSLLKKLPISLCDDYVFSQTAWLAAVKWSVNPVKELHLRDLSLDYLSKISNFEIKLGIAHLLWSKVFHRLNLSIWDHLNQAREPLFPRSVEKDFHVSSVDSLIEILNFSSVLVETLLQEPMDDDSLDFPEGASSLVDPKRNLYNCEEHWIEAARGNQECIPELSQKQPRCNYSLLQHMKLLISALTMFVKLDLHRKFGIRPLAVFDDVQCQAFSQALHSFPLTSSRETSKQLEVSRNHFFEKVFLEFVPLSSSSIGTDGIQCSKLYELGELFNLPTDWLTQTHVTTLYWLSLDTHASMFLPKVEDELSLALRLVEVLAYRVSYVIKGKIKTHGLTEVSARVPTALSLWLETTKPSEIYATRAVATENIRGIECTINLSRLIMRILPSSHSLHNICQLCIDALNFLLTIQ